MVLDGCLAYHKVYGNRDQRRSMHLLAWVVEDFASDAV